MILTDKLGTLIYPGQIHGLAVEANLARVSSLYPRPEGATCALVVVGQVLGQHPDGDYYMVSTRYVLAWFDLESLAQAALEELIASLSIVYQVSLREICEGEL